VLLTAVITVSKRINCQWKHYRESYKMPTHSDLEYRLYLNQSLRWCLANKCRRQMQVVDCNLITNQDIKVTTFWSSNFFTFIRSRLCLMKAGHDTDRNENKNSEDNWYTERTKHRGQVKYQSYPNGDWEYLKQRAPVWAPECQQYDDVCAYKWPHLCI